MGEKSSPSESSSSIVRTLWHGSPLSVFEELCLRSFVQCGHQVELYTYMDTQAPAGVRVCDANEVLPEAQAFAYAKGPAKGSFAAFSNLFRFKLLYEHGGIWADADMLCLKSLDLLPDAWAGQVCSYTPGHLNTAVIKMPQGHPVARDVYHALEIEGRNLVLGSTGGLLTRAARRHANCFESLPVDYFYPLTWRDTWLLVDPDQYEACSARVANSYGVHWWNTAITYGIGMPKDALPPAGSYLHCMAERLFAPEAVTAWPVSVARVWIDHFNQIQESIAAIEPGSNVVSKIEFNIDHGDGTFEIAGWAFDRARPWEPVTIIFLQDAEIIHFQRTTGVREDINAAYPKQRPRQVSFHGRVKLKQIIPIISSTGQLMSAMRRQPDITVLAIGASGSASVIGCVRTTS